MMRKTWKPAPGRRFEIEALEGRQMLSAAGDTVMHLNLSLAPLAASSFGGYTPAQIRHAYGFDQVSQNGAGQTIAIVDAFNDPNIASDLRVFDRKFGLADPPSFRKVSQSGGSTAGIANDAGWSSEIALDVEWAHAIAPAASILLVEAKSANTSDLMAAVDYGRRAAGVSVVSMSWGGSEFWRQTRYDSVFTTPAGHQGVTFVAAAGDGGGWYAPEWPASSPNVLSVGGTVLRTAAGGSYRSEVAWAYNDGGVSSFEVQPSYQNAAQSSGSRSAPDVAYNASIIYGFAVYSSVPDQGTVGWSNVGGTSAGAPQWAALVALADQGRVARGVGTLDGRQGTLPVLYSLYNSSRAYSASFHDTVNDAYYGASVGYDTATGLGSPNAPVVVSALINASSASARTRAARLRAAASSGTMAHLNMTAASAASETAVPVLAPTASVAGASTPAPAPLRSAREAFTGLAMAVSAVQSPRGQAASANMAAAPDATISPVFSTARLSRATDALERLVQITGPDQPQSSPGGLALDSLAGSGDRTPATPAAPSPLPLEALDLSKLMDASLLADAMAAMAVPLAPADGRGTGAENWPPSACWAWGAPMALADVAILSYWWRARAARRDQSAASAVFRP